MIGKLDKEIIEKFKEFQEKTGKYSELYIEDVEFEEKALKYIANFPAMTRISGGTDKSISEFNLLSSVEKNNYKPLISGTIVNNQISGYVHVDRLSENSLSKEKVISWTRINSEVFFIQKNSVCTNDDSFVMEVKKDYVIEYVQFSSMVMMKYKQFNWGNKAGKTKVKEVEIPIPKDLNKFYSSSQIQEAIVEFLEACKIGYTDIHRERVNRKQPILKTIKKILVPNTFKYDKKLVESFNLFSKKKGYDLNFEDIEFEKNDIFNDEKNIQLIGSKKLGTHDELKKIHDDKGFPVYDASANILTYIKESRFTNEIFEVIDKFNPDISFASEGNSSAGTNFIIHDGKYYVNNHRTVIKFSKKYYSKYIYYNIFRMKEKYGFKRGYIPSQQELKKLKIMVSIPKGLPHRYDSLGIQNILVEFWEIIILDIDNQLKIYDRTLELADKIDEAFLYRTFSKIDWSKK